MQEFRRIEEPWAPLTKEERKRRDVPFEIEEWWFAPSGKMRKVEHHWKHTAQGLIDEGRKGFWKDPVVDYEQMVKIFDLMREHDCTLARALVEVVGEHMISPARVEELKEAPAYKHRRAKGYVPPKTETTPKKPDAEWKDLSTGKKPVMRKVTSDQE